MKGKETVIVNVKLYDGSGEPPRLADVVIAGNIITEVLPPETAPLPGRNAIPAPGLALAPGFIDIHGHSDLTVIKAPECEAKIAQGITTEVTGNCGCSKCVERFPHWDNVADYAKAVNAARPAMNTATLAGHNSLRERIIGYEDRPATRQELQQMKDILSRALDDGACGFSGGLWYLPGKYAPTSEMLYLAESLQGTGKPYANHMRSEGDGLLEALNEAMNIARHGDRKLQISHLKAAPRRNWDKIFNVFQTIEHHRRHGLEIYSDRYPYTYSSTGLKQVLGRPWNRLHNLQECFQDPRQVQEAIHQLDTTHTPEDDWQRSILLDDIPDILPHAAGMTIWEISRRLHLTPGAAVVKILSRHTPAAAFGKMSERNMRLIIQQPWVFPCTDATAVPFDGSLGREHPRAFGSFPGFFRIACETAPPEQVIRRMTALPAAFFNLPHRGLIKSGYVADLVLFNESDYRSQSTYDCPHRPPTGITAVFVNGHLTYDGVTHAVLGRYGTFLPIPNQSR